MTDAPDHIRLDGAAYTRWWRENRRWLHREASDGLAYSRWWRAHRGGQNHEPRYQAYIRDHLAALPRVGSAER